MLKKLQLGKALDIQGWMSELELQFLAEVANEVDTIFEIGSYCGRSARAMADNSNAIIYCIDPWNADCWNNNGIAFTTDDSTYAVFRSKLFGYIKLGRVIPCRSAWMDYQPLMKADFIFIDGNHRYKDVREDIDKALKWVKPGGLIAGHDFEPQWSGVVKAVEETFPKFDLIDTIWSVHV